MSATCLRYSVCNILLYFRLLVYNMRCFPLPFSLLSSFIVVENLKLFIFVLIIYMQGEFIICINCFKNQNYGENRSINEFKLVECAEKSVDRGAIWTEAETLLLLESVLKHGDDWELVAQSVQTKSKVDCILKLIELPFGELMLSSAHKYGNFGGLNGGMNSAKPGELSSSEYHEGIKTEGQCHEQISEREENGNAEEQGPPSKRRHIDSLSDAGSSLMKQVGDLVSST